MNRVQKKGYIETIKGRIEDWDNIICGIKQEIKNKQEDLKSYIKTCERLKTLLK